MRVDEVLRLKGVSKLFKIQTEAKTLYQVLNRVFSRKSKTKNIWALKDIDIGIQKGQKTGLIGDNGAGKTTLLKIILDVIKPTTGIVELNGSATGFLSLGVGMERDLSVLDNIGLFAMIMGVDKKDVDERIEDILKFSGLNEYADSPIRDLSTGMHQRLAFSIAIQSNSQLLVLDEILVSGDVKFQNKTKKYLEKTRQDDFSLFFTSHDLGLIEKFCDNVVWLEKGRIQENGSPEKVVRRYYDSKN